MQEAPEIKYKYCGYQGEAVLSPVGKGWQCKKCDEPRSPPSMPGSGSTPVIRDSGYREES